MTTILRNLPKTEELTSVRDYCDNRITKIRAEQKANLEKQIAEYDALPFFKRVFAIDPRPSNDRIGSVLCDYDIIYELRALNRMVELCDNLLALKQTYLPNQISLSILDAGDYDFCLSEIEKGKK